MGWGGWSEAGQRQEAFSSDWMTEKLPSLFPCTRAKLHAHQFFVKVHDLDTSGMTLLPLLHWKCLRLWKRTGRAKTNILYYMYTYTYVYIMDLFVRVNLQHHMALA